MKEKINIYPDQDLREWIKESANSQNRSVNNFILTIIKYFAEHPEISGLKILESSENA